MTTAQFDETLDSLGFDAGWQAACEQRQYATELAARVVGEQRGAHILQTRQALRLASPSGSLRHSQATDPNADHPAVGDWVIVRPERGDRHSERRQIMAVLPRRTYVSRKVAGRAYKEQIVAANVDTVLIVCAFGGDINLRKLERFIAIARTGGGQPVVLLNKADLADATNPWVERVRDIASNTPIHCICAHSGAGLSNLLPYLQPAKTLVLLGSSGAGKSTLLNRWLGDDSQRTMPLDKAGQGQHTTRTRTLIALPSGALIIDTPGLREVGLWDAEDGVAATFSDIVALALHCRFRNCRHTTEPGCALQQGLSSGTLTPQRLQAYLQLKVELAGTADRALLRRRGPIG